MASPSLAVPEEPHQPFNILTTQVLVAPALGWELGTSYIVVEPDSHIKKWKSDLSGILSWCCTVSKSVAITR